jgi:hypothetical protein
LQVYLVTGLNSKLTRRGDRLRVSVPPPGYHQGLYDNGDDESDDDDDEPATTTRRTRSKKKKKQQL